MNIARVMKRERDAVRQLIACAMDAEQRNEYLYAMFFRNAAKLVTELRQDRTNARRTGDNAATAAALAGEQLREHEQTINRLRQERDAYRAETERRAANAETYRTRASKLSARCTEYKAHLRDLTRQNELLTHARDTLADERDLAQGRLRRLASELKGWGVR